jgi:hypothetical protein
MATVQSILDSARYDLVDFETGIEFDDNELLNYLNRMVEIMDSTLASLHSEMVHGTEEDIDIASGAKYADLSDLNGGHWDSIRSVWIGQDLLEELPLDLLYYKRKFRASNTGQPYYWTVEGPTIQFENATDAAYTNLVIHYNKTWRPLLHEAQSITFTANATTDLITLASDPGFMKIDGPVTFTNSGGALPAGLSTSTNYWLLRATATTYYVCTSQGAAMDGSYVDITDAGTGTQTMAHTDVMPYNDRFNQFMREMLVMHAKAKKEGVLERPEQVYSTIFRQRAMEETVRRNFIKKLYYLDF